MRTQPAPTKSVFGIFAALSVLGMVALAVTAIIGFEEPNSTLLLFSSILLLAAPAAVLVHLATTKALTRQEKRRWIRELTSRRAPRALSDYLTSQGRRTDGEEFRPK